MDMVEELEEEEALFEAMQLKPAQVKLLKKRLAEAPLAAPPLGKQMSARL